MAPETLPAQTTAVGQAVDGFVRWLDAFGETSRDHQSFFAGPIGRAAKSLYYRNRLLGTVAVSPMILCEAFLPSARNLFWKPRRFPIADAHYASGFAFLAAGDAATESYRRAVHFLNVLIETRSPRYEHYGWGYPFDWVTLTGTLKEATPFITTLPYVYEAFDQVYRIDRDEKWRRVMHSIAEHARLDYADLETSATASSCAYMPGPPDPARVINASAYRAFLLTKAGCEFDDSQYQAIAGRNLNFVLESQNDDGSWFYSADGRRDFVDHFHTCFVLKALAKIQQLRPSAATAGAIARGIDYYLHNLVDTDGLPKPFSRAPRMTVYKRELYDCAECINLALLLRSDFPEVDRLLATVVGDVLDRWRRPDGSFRSRELMLGWDNVPMHRWAQSQLFRSFCLFLHLGQARVQAAGN
jgi:hypothetical protein